ncbi:MAG: metalloregulator ArsR/SmtB family transcription factor [Fimbriimonadaceae bacterium]|nr:metalloregulator ArsR/SmtB family transcription factor [Alphaproteobacteria bacterium]
MDLDDLLAGLRAGNDRTRLRLLALLAQSDLNVKDLTRILRQSQPRISRHLKLLNEAGLIDRFQEGSWVFYRIAGSSPQASLARTVIAHLNPNDAIIVRDRERLIEVKEERATIAADYFRAHAADWDRVRALHVSEEDVETAMREELGAEPFDRLLDIGTGTGRSLELFSDHFNQGIGIDTSRDMLAVARARLEAAKLVHCQVRYRDLYDLPFDGGQFDVVIIHQVLHYLDEPGRAIEVAAGILAPGGRLLIVDFDAHDQDFLREEHAHLRLGFRGGEVKQWIADAGLKLIRQRKLTPPEKLGDTAITVSLWLANLPTGDENKARPATQNIEVHS